MLNLIEPLKEDNIIIRGRSRVVAFMTLILSALTLFACFAGIFDKSIYESILKTEIITETLLDGSVAQDIIFIPQAILLALLSVLYLRRPRYKTFIAMLGITCSLFYGYGLYAMQGQYTSIYLVYLAIFGLSVYSIVLGLLSFNAEFESKISLPRSMQISTSIFMFSMVFMLGLIWIIRIMPDISRHIPQAIYGVFVLDLCIVFPAVAITATKLIQNRPFGSVLTGVVLLKILTVCLSWGFGEWYGRFKGSLQGSFDMLVIPSVLTIISTIFFVLYMFKLKRRVN